MRKRYNGEFKAKIALEAIKGQRTINEIASEYEVHPNQISTWKREAQAGMSQVFTGQKVSHTKAEEKLKDRLYSQIGKLKVEIDWLKKKTGITD